MFWNVYVVCKVKLSFKSSFSSIRQINFLIINLSNSGAIQKKTHLWLTGVSGHFLMSHHSYQWTWYIKTVNAIHIISNTWIWVTMDWPKWLTPASGTCAYMSCNKECSIYQHKDLLCGKKSALQCILNCLVFQQWTVCETEWCLKAGLRTLHINTWSDKTSVFPGHFSVRNIRFPSIETPVCLTVICRRVLSLLVYCRIC